MNATTKTRAEVIREWVTREFAARYVESVTQDLLDVATGNRLGNNFEMAALKKLFSNGKR